METNTQVENVEVPAKAKRGRPEKMDKARVEALLEICKTQDRTLKAVCAERHIPYITVVVARKRHGLQEKDLAVTVAAEAPAA